MPYHRYMLSSPEEVQSYTDEVMVYPACAVTKAMTKRLKVKVGIWKR